MDGFQFYPVPKIVFEAGVFARLGECVAGLGDQPPAAALLVTNAGEVGDGRHVDAAMASLRAAGVACAVHRQRGEPTVEDVQAAVATAREAACTAVVGFGGGSAIDTAKAVAGLLTNGGGPLDYMEVIGQGKPIMRPAAPWLAVPTTAGTGAEVTRNAVVCDRDRGVKASMRSELLLPSAVLVDPELGVGVRPSVTASAGMDALCQLIESYTSAKAQPMTDALALAGVAKAARALPRACRDGRDIEARGDMALAALLSGITLTNAGLGAVHGLAGAMGGRFPLAHGVICAALLPPVIAANARAMREESAAHPGLARYAALGRVLTGAVGLDPAEAIDAAVSFVAELAREIGIAGLGLREADALSVIPAARTSSSMRYNPVSLTDEALAEVLRQAL